MFIITGFQPFGSNSYNPAEILARKTAKLLEESGIKCSSESIAVTPEAADQFYDNLNVENKDNLPFVVHIGLDASSSEMCLETQAKNTLVLPFEEKRSITDQHSIKSQLHNPFNVKDLQKTLSSQFSLSNDAGTYICNYIYYRGIQNTGQKVKGCIFVHVPLFEVIPEKIQTENLCNLIRKINEII